MNELSLKIFDFDIISSGDGDRVERALNRRQVNEIAIDSITISIAVGFWLNEN